MVDSEFAIKYRHYQLPIYEEKDNKYNKIGNQNVTIDMDKRYYVLNTELTTYMEKEYIVNRRMYYAKILADSGFSLYDFCKLYQLRPGVFNLLNEDLDNFNIKFSDTNITTEPYKDISQEILECIESEIKSEDSTNVLNSYGLVYYPEQEEQIKRKIDSYYLRNVSTFHKDMIYDILSGKNIDNIIKESDYDKFSFYDIINKIYGVHTKNKLEKIVKEYQLMTSSTTMLILAGFTLHDITSYMGIQEKEYLTIRAKLNEMGLLSDEKEINMAKDLYELGVKQKYIYTLANISPANREFKEFVKNHKGQVNELKDDMIFELYMENRYTKDELGYYLGYSRASIINYINEYLSRHPEDKERHDELSNHKVGISKNEFLLQRMFEKYGFIKKEKGSLSEFGFGRKELDIYYEKGNIKIAIEYDGYLADKERNLGHTIENDTNKDKLCYNNGIDIIRIREPQLPQLENGISKVFYLDTTFYYDKSFADTINDVIQYLNETYDLNIKVIENFDEYMKDLSKFCETYKSNYYEQYIGMKCHMNCGLDAIITDYINASDITVRFCNGEIKRHVQLGTFKKGNVKPPSMSPQILFGQLRKQEQRIEENEIELMERS